MVNQPPLPDPDAPIATNRGSRNELALPITPTTGIITLPTPAPAPAAPPRIPVLTRSVEDYFQDNPLPTMMNNIPDSLRRLPDIGTIRDHNILSPNAVAFAPVGFSQTVRDQLDENNQRLSAHGREFGALVKDLNLTGSAAYLRDNWSDALGAAVVREGEKAINRFVYRQEPLTPSDVYSLRRDGAPLPDPGRFDPSIELYSTRVGSGTLTFGADVDYDFEAHRADYAVGFNFTMPLGGGSKGR